MAILPKAIYRFNVIPIKTPMTLFTEVEQIILKFTGKLKGLQIAKTTLKKKEKIAALKCPVFKIYDKAAVNKTVWYWDKDRPIDQRNRIESPEINLCIYGQMIFMGVPTPMGKGQSF